MSYDYDLFVIGAGSGGVRAARFAAGYGAKVAIAEDTYLGGTCVNVGCVPKKLFVYASHYSHDFKEAAGFGWEASAGKLNWQQLLDNKNSEIGRLNNVYEKLLDISGVTLHRGHATLIDNQTVAVGGEYYRAKKILLAVGARPWVPELPGAEYVLTSDDMFYLSQLPRDIVIVGGGYISVEFAGILSGLGVRVTQLYRGELFLRGFDRELRERLAEEVRKTAVELRFNASVTAIEKRSDGRLEVQLADGEPLVTDAVLYATGRVPRLEGLGADKLGIECNDRGFIQVDKHFQTSAEHVYAIGDIIPGMELTPRALAEGMAFAKTQFQGMEECVDYEFIPTAVFSQPNVATVGYSEEKARELYGKIDVYTAHFTPLKHTLTGSDEKSFMKLIVDAQSDRVVGVHMIGEAAGEIMQGIAIAMKAGASKATFDRTIGIHPTAAEEFVTMREKVR